jgi:hypothetical protein
MRNGTPGKLTIGELERMLQKRRSALDELTRERAKLQKRVDAVDTNIRSLSGGAAPSGFTAGGRARNEMSLVEALRAVLSKAGKPLKVGDIVDKVQASGYRSNAANFRALVNQTLIKQRKLFANAGRGLYAAKK